MSVALTTAPLPENGSVSRNREPDFWNKLTVDFYRKRNPVEAEKSSGLTGVKIPSGEAELTVPKRQNRPANDFHLIAPFERAPLEKPYVLGFLPLQEWEGHVVFKGTETFTARLVDITGEAEQDQDVVELPASELSDADWAKLKEGSIFRWLIGYELIRTGQKKRTSMIIVRDMPRWSAKELAEARIKGKERAARISWD